MPVIFLRTAHVALRGVIDSANIFFSVKAGNVRFPGSDN